jgi:hypothetical protein
VAGRANFQLELISMESARIVDDFALPDEIDPLKLIDQLGKTIEEGQEICREELRTKMRSKGYKEVFGTLLKKASRLIYRDLKNILHERASRMGK